MCKYRCASENRSKHTNTCLCTTYRDKCNITLCNDSVIRVENPCQKLFSWKKLQLKLNLIFDENRNFFFFAGKLFSHSFPFFCILLFFLFWFFFCSRLHFAFRIFFSSFWCKQNEYWRVMVAVAVGGGHHGDVSKCECVVCLQYDAMCGADAGENDLSIYVVRWNQREGKQSDGWEKSVFHTEFK